MSTPETMPEAAQDAKATQWEAKVAHVLERGHNRCECCGVPNGHWIQRSAATPQLWERVKGIDDQVKDPNGVWERSSKVVLTVIALDPSGNLTDVEHLLALCQRCAAPHLRLMRKIRAAGHEFALIPSGTTIPASWAANPNFLKMSGR